MYTRYPMWYASLSSPSKDAVTVWAGEFRPELTAHGRWATLHRCVPFCVWIRSSEMGEGTDEVYAMMFYQVVHIISGIVWQLEVDIVGLLGPGRMWFELGHD